ncbi:hypothetical protein [Actinokineospora sp.]|uniref:hypothetical protein n=1 Tax=Actinokineospora sp. TaxID=1872133 RepID=UPI0040382772
MSTTSEPHELSYRALAMLRAVQAGRAQMSCSREPDLYIDGVPCCDQFSAHVLTHDGLIAGAQGLFGQLVAATLTPAGHAALASVAVAA